ncbi:MAG: ABC transporter substrate-binding protein [Gammaproteobacteria bacterium]|nr:ABC transporter substrate-binding protein [Gammaproteobacteria bacterium]
MNFRSTVCAAAGGVGLALLASIAPAVGAEPPGPTAVIEKMATSLAAAVDADRERLAANPPALYQLVDETLLPAFDTRYAAQLVLGRHARTATPQQRKDFVDAFYDFLVRSYADSALKFQKDRVKILPTPGAAATDKGRTAVRTLMDLDDGSTISVDYSLSLRDGLWRIYDVRIEGISYVQTYRNQFDAEINARGLDAVIARLEADAERLNPQPTADGSPSAAP